MLRQWPQGAVRDLKYPLYSLGQRRWGQALCSVFKTWAVSILVAVSCQVADS